MFHTFIILDLGSDGLGGISIPDLIHSLNTELILLVLGQVLNGPAAFSEDLAVCDIKLIAIRPHLLNIVAPNGGTTISVRRLPGQGDAGLASVSVVQLLGSRWSTWNVELEFVQNKDSQIVCSFLSGKVI